MQAIILLNFSYKENRKRTIIHVNKTLATTGKWQACCNFMCLSNTSSYHWDKCSFITSHVNCLQIATIHLVSLSLILRFYINIYKYNIYINIIYKSTLPLNYLFMIKIGSKNVKKKKGVLIHVFVFNTAQLQWVQLPIWEERDDTYIDNLAVLSPLQRFNSVYSSHQESK
jgi:hypothetical protein